MKKVWRRLFTLLTALALCVALLPPQPTRAESLNLPTEDEAIELLRTYRVARGDADGNLWLEKNLTRAEAATLFVRAMGREEEATSTHLVVPPFLDAMSHWGAPYIAEIAKLGLMKGDPTGNFRPDAPITYAEVLTVLFRMAEKELPDPWTAEGIFMAAQEIGLAPVGTEPTQNAARGKIFWSLASTISRIQLPSSGKTLMQMYLDTIPPDLTLDQTSIITREANITIGGTSFEAEKLLINGKPITRDKNGRFTLRQAVKIGNLAFDVVAIDRAGNENVQQVIVSVLPPISRIDVTAPSEYKVGSDTKITVKAFDTMGQEVTDLSELQVSTTGDVVTFDPLTKTVYAGNLPGKGALVFKWGRITKNVPITVSGPAFTGAKLAITNSALIRPFATGKDAAVQIQVQDANGKLVTTDNFRPITLRLDGLAGARLTTSTVETKGGTATAVMQAPTEGTATLTVTSPDLPTLTLPISFLTSPRVVLSTAATSLLPDGAAKTKITAALQDETGRGVTASEDLVINLSLSGVSSSLTSNSVMIKKGTSRSTDTVELVAGFATGDVQINGTFSGLGYSVQPAKVSITGTLNARKLVVTGPTTPPAPGAPTTITLKVVDNANALVTTGSYAFQFEVRTEKNDPLVNGLPAGVTLTFSGSPKTPVDDGRAPTDSLANPDSVIGRTVGGIATLSLTVPPTQSGKMILTPKGVGAGTAFNPTGGDAPALPSAGLFTQPIEVLFLGAPHHIELTATSQMGANLPAATSTGATNIQVTARVVDANGYTIPGNTDTISLARMTGGNAISAISGATSTTAVNGVARFTVATTSTVGFDRYQATNGSLTSAPFTVAVRNARPLTPNVAKVSGATATTINATGLVAPTDTHLALELFHQDPQLPGETTNWVTVYVYRKGEGAPLIQGVPVDLAAANPVVRIPRAQLPVGTATYELVIANGAGSSDRSPDLGLSTATVKSFTDSYPLRAAYLDGVTGTLDLIDYNLPTTGTIDVSKILLVKGTTVLTLDPAQVTVASLTSNGVSLNLGAQLAALSPDVWSGPIKVTAAGGWYDGQTAGWITNGSETTLQPAPNITRAAYDPDQRSLYLYGTNLNTGALQLDKLAINKPGNPAMALLTSQDFVALNSGTMIRIQLGTTTQTALNALGGNDLTLSGNPGWLLLSGNGKTYGALALTGAPRPVYRFVQVTSWKYDRATKTVTINGRGLNGAQLDPQKLRFEALGEVLVRWSPTLAPTLVAASDTTVSFALTGTDATEFEANFTGRQTYLNTLSGWLVDPLGRPADLVTDYSVLFGVPR